MDVPALIQKKRDGGAFSSVEIGHLVRGYVHGVIPDYQMAALAMAIFFQGMRPDETAALTREMLHSGSHLQWSSPSPMKVDKHSTGGIGDKVSLILAPLVASCGLHVPMISGRGLGTSGGTLDKLESIAGFRTDLTVAEIREMTERVGCVITGATDDIAPADRKLYELRDVTATVESIPLITASIMSKKLAESLGALVLDVKFGSGAFMKTRDQARELARSLVETGVGMGVKTRALLTDMNQPLGRMAGNAVEVDEALATLAGNGPDDLVEVVLELAVELLLLANVTESRDEGFERLRQNIDTGRAMEKFCEMVALQGGDLNATRTVAQESVVGSKSAGFVTSVDLGKFGQAIVQLGGGRMKKGDPIDPSVGLEMLVRIGDRVDRDQPVLKVFAPENGAAQVRPLLEGAIVVGEQRPRKVPLIVDSILPLNDLLN